MRAKSSSLSAESTPLRPDKITSGFRGTIKDSKGDTEAINLRPDFTGGFSGKITSKKQLENVLIIK
ncbi:MAG TPA: hypothetical protein ACFYD3_09715 [Candidatus Hypogeohydataceae bacterium YC41]